MSENNGLDKLSELMCLMKGSIGDARDDIKKSQDSLASAQRDRQELSESEYNALVAASLQNQNRAKSELDSLYQTLEKTIAYVKMD